MPSVYGVLLAFDLSRRGFVFPFIIIYDLVMPTIRGISGPYRVFFFSFDCNEPKHVHVQRERSVCKYWMDPLALASNHGFSPVELNAIRRMLKDKHTQILEAWHEHCGSN